MNIIFGIFYVIFFTFLHLSTKSSVIVCFWGRVHICICKLIGVVFGVFPGTSKCSFIVWGRIFLLNRFCCHSRKFSAQQRNFKILGPHVTAYT